MTTASLLTEPKVTVMAQLEGPVGDYQALAARIDNVPVKRTLFLTQAAPPSPTTRQLP